MRPPWARCALGPDVQYSRTLWEDHSNDICHACGSGSEHKFSLLICSFCNAALHNTGSCLVGMKSISELCVQSKVMEWACTLCWKKVLHTATKLVRRPAAGKPAEKRVRLRK